MAKSVEKLVVRKESTGGILTRNDADLAPEVVKSDGRDVDPVDPNASSGRLDDPEESEREGRLSSARSSADSDLLSFLDLERDSLDARLEILSVSSRVVPELDSSLEKARGRNGQSRGRFGGRNEF